MKISIIGAGNMGEAIISGIKGQDYKIMASDIRKERLDFLKQEYKIRTTLNNLDLLKFAKIIILAVKPQIIRNVLQEIKEKIKDHLIISIAAGIKTSTIEKALGKIRVIRVMPNTPCLVSCGISAMAKGKYANDFDMEVANKIFSAIGEVVVIDELLMNSVTALSGSGPAYIALIIDALISVGVKMGLSYDVSKKLVLETISGSVALLKKTGKHPMALRDMVVSPGGTTAYALEVMERGGMGLTGIIHKAVLAAEKRAKKLK